MFRLVEARNPETARIPVDTHRSREVVLLPFSLFFAKSRKAVRDSAILWSRSWRSCMVNVSQSRARLIRAIKKVCAVRKKTRMEFSRMKRLKLISELMKCIERNLDFIHCILIKPSQVAVSYLNSLVRGYRIHEIYKQSCKIKQ